VPIPNGPINSNTHIPNTRERIIRKLFFDQYTADVKYYPTIFNVVSSSKYKETDWVGTQFGLFQPTSEGNEPSEDAATEAWTKEFVHLQWGLKFRLTRIAREDDLYGYIAKLPRGLGESAAYTQELTAWSLFNDLSATVYTAGGSNFTLLSTTQFRADEGTWSNSLSSGADLSPESLDLLLQQWMDGMVNQRGMKIAGSVPPKYVLCGTNDVNLVQQILKSSQYPGNANNDINPFKSWNLEPLVVPHLTNDGRWFLVAEKSKTGLTWFNRRPLSIERDTDGTGSGNEIYSATYRSISGTAHVTGIMGSA
jgi:hypothetical protein